VIIECDRCYARYRYDEARFQGKPSKRVRCTKCLSVFEVANPAIAGAGGAVAEPAPEETYTRLEETGARRPADAGRATRQRTAERARTSESLALPEESKLSLAVIAGPAAGSIFVIEKPRVVIGREASDVLLDDPEVSRNHAAIEVYGDRTALVDLNSTNGTYLGGETVREAVLENQDEFTVGGSTLMLIVTPKS
jgi:predicted Zn finger-like uncharacterized protein